MGGEKYMLVAGDPGEVIRGKKGSGESRRQAAATRNWGQPPGG